MSHLDNFGNVFVAYLDGARTVLSILISTNFGQTFSELFTVPGTALRNPAIATGTGTGGTSSLWIAVGNSP